MKATKATQAALLKVLRDSFRAYSRQDLDKLMEYYSGERDLVCIGTGKDEHYVGFEALREGFERDFIQSQSASLKIKPLSASVAGTVAWLAAESTVTVKMETSSVVIRGRLTCVFERKGRRWIIVQSHFSVPMADQKAGHSFPGKRRK